MPSIVPPQRPDLTREAAEAMLAQAGFRGTLALLGRRGYYRDTMGVVGENDRGLYDDAIALVAPKHFAAWNASTDPSRRGGRLAVLQPGIWTYKRGIHHPGTPSAYPCLVQAGPVTVLRDNGVLETGSPHDPDGPSGRPPYIHIHRGGYTTTGSEGCQTIHPEQWHLAFAAIADAMEAAHVSTIPYVLTVRPEGA